MKITNIWNHRPVLGFHERFLGLWLICEPKSLKGVYKGCFVGGWFVPGATTPSPQASCKTKQFRTPLDLLHISTKTTPVYRITSRCILFTWSLFPDSTIDIPRYRRRSMGSGMHIFCVKNWALTSGFWSLLFSLCLFRLIDEMNLMNLYGFIFCLVRNDFGIQQVHTQMAIWESMWGLSKIEGP